MIYNFLSDYLSIIIFLFIALFLSIGFIVANILASPSNPDPEKLSAYECGFEAFDDSRMEFDVRFYLVAILFIIFDLEIAFLFPWAISLGSLGPLGFLRLKDITEGGIDSSGNEGLRDQRVALQWIQKNIEHFLDWLLKQCIL